MPLVSLFSRDHTGTKGQYAEDKEVVIGWPSRKERAAMERKTMT